MKSTLQNHAAHSASKVVLERIYGDGMFVCVVVQLCLLIFSEYKKLPEVF